MAHRFPRRGVIDKIWSIAADGRWHSRRSLIDQIPFKATEVVAALDFLVKYGFAESSTAGEEKFRMITDGPSPMEAANLLRAVQIDAH